MPGVEYSPNNRAHCQKCGGKIKKDQVRVSTLSSSGRGAGDYTKQFTHAECYTGRTDFTKFFGFRDLWPLDQKRFMTEKQKRVNYPQDYVVEEKVVAVDPVTYGDVAAVPSVNEFVDNDDDELANFDMDAAISSYATVSKEANAGPPPVAAEPSSRSEPQKKHAIYNVGPVLMIGLKSAHARAVPGEKVTLVRDPGNVSFINMVQLFLLINATCKHSHNLLFYFDLDI